MACVFCNPEDVVVENDLAYVIYDKHPVSEGHLLVIPKRHLASFFETSREERKALLEMLQGAREYVIYEHSPQGGGADRRTPAYPPHPQVRGGHRRSQGRHKGCGPR